MVELSLTFEEAAFGGKHEVPVESMEPCDRCSGSGCEPGTHPSRCSRCGGTGELQNVSRSMFGTVMTSTPCTTCEGTGEEIAAPCAECRAEGRVARVQEVAVDVPPGVADGMELRISAAGNEGRLGGPPGDLYVSLRVAPHEVFERRGQDLVCALVLPMTQAALGTEVDIPTLEGNERLRVEPGTQPGTILRLRGRGVPNLGRRGRGDLLVTVMVETPKPASKEERTLLERLAAMREERSTKGRGFVGRLRKLIES